MWPVNSNGMKINTILKSAFTLIEVLVVIAIIAVLLAILLPTLKKAKEQARTSACLSNLNQQGIGFSTYSIDHKQMLPWAGSFRFSLMEGMYYLGFKPPEAHDWTAVNSGVLYPKYIGNDPEIFYCPNNRTADINGSNGKKVFLQRFQHPKRDDPQYKNSHNFPISPFGAYGYAVPAASAQYPRDAGDDMYPDNVVRYHKTEKGYGINPYWRYLNDPNVPDISFLGPFPQGIRGKHNIHAFVSDGYFGGYQGYHNQGYNVLYSDFHAKRVRDPGGRIYAANLGPIRPWTYSGIEDAKVYMVWDYFSRNH